MTILDWIKRRTKSRYADDKAVDEFARGAKAQGVPLDYDRDKRLSELLGSERRSGSKLRRDRKTIGEG